VGPTRYELPLPPGLERKWNAIEQVIDYRVLARGVRSAGRFQLHGDFYARVPDRVRRAVRRLQAQAVVAEDPRTAALALLGRPGAWRRAEPRLPGARLVVVGTGSQLNAVEGLEHHERLAPEQVAAKLDESTVLVLPSRYEGLGRVVIEAFARGRGVVASRAG